MSRVAQLTRRPPVRLVWQLPLAAALAVLGYLAAAPHPAVLALLYLAAITPALVRTDLREHRLPNRLVVPGIAIGALTIAATWVDSGSPPLVPLVAAACYSGFLLALSWRGGMGAGDVKLAAALGLASWTPTVAVLSPVIAFLAGGIVSGILLARGARNSRIAFGPYLLLGFWLAVALSVLTA
ncbi:A24 family peptidase [Glaciihabitans sp. dw_435]|uniref:prepilin peptidase n=1 Tax=Glaciihabitans sp. dw_435 TaxID=2720081 RepID=UPI001BD3C98B|nr:A24 family peptidase [Glaciihabitans sp. dw_435]